MDQASFADHQTKPCQDMGEGRGGEREEVNHYMMLSSSPGPSQLFTVAYCYMYKAGWTMEPGDEASNILQTRVYNDSSFLLYDYYMYVYCEELQ